MSNTTTKALMFTNILFAAAFVVAILTVVLPFSARKQKNARLYSCINNLRQIDGAKDGYYFEYGGSNGSLFTWYNLSLYIKDISNRCICPASHGWQTNVPEDCYDIGIYGTNPSCRVARPEEGHSLSNKRAIRVSILKSWKVD